MISSFSVVSIVEVAEAHRAGGRHEREDRLDRFAHADPDRREVIGANFGRRGWEQPGSGGREEGVERNALQRVGSQRSERLFRARAAGEGARSLGQVRLQHLRRVLEGLAVEEPGEQEVALLEAGKLLVEIDVVAAGKQPARLQLDEGCRDEEELGGRLEIDPLHLLDFGAERIDDPSERDLPEIDLFLEDQMQQEIERALENRCRDLVGHGAQGIQRGGGFVAPRGARKAPGDRGSRR